MPSKRVRKAEKVALRDSYAKQIADLWAPVLGKTADLVASLESSAQQSSEMSEFYSLLSDLKSAYESGDIDAFLRSTRAAFGIFKDVKRFYRCLLRLDSGSEQSSPDPVTTRILTYQSSKGLEADCVFVVGLEELVIPKSAQDPKVTAEDARLLFVAMTRAKKELHLHHVRTRTGASTFQAGSHGLKRSPFLDGMPKGQFENAYIQSETARKAARK
jgi:superfamily I DNA/RNA helicase